MNFSTEISEELLKISPVLAAIEKKNVFFVPENYFETINLELIKKLDIDFFSSNANNLYVPNAYFENLGDNILKKIKVQELDPAEELKAISPMLYSIQNESAFTIPPGYFQQLPEIIFDKIIGKTKTKLVGLKRRSSIWRYSVAALITGIIALCSFFIINSTKYTSANANNNIGGNSKIETSQYKNQDQVEHGIAGLSDEEIIKYLEKTGSDVDNEELISSIDEKALPAQNEYLLNEQILNTYLDTLYKKSSQN